MKVRESINITFLALLLAFLASGCSSSNNTSDEKVWVERWSRENDMNIKRAGLGAVSVGKRIYAIGGGEYSNKGLDIFDSVEYAEVLDDGRLGEWKLTSPLKMPRIYVSTVVYGDYIYVMGGESLDEIFTGALDQAPPSLLDSVERAKILPDGTLGEWILEKERMGYSRRGGELFAHNGWLYAVGGYNGIFLKDVEKAKINPDGSLGKWVREENAVNNSRYISGYMQKGNRFYLLGGHLSNAARAMNSVETSEVNEDSSTGEWKEVAPMYTRRFLNAAVLKGDTIYTIAGQNTINLSSVDKAKILDDGTLSGWVPETPLNIPKRAASSVIIDNTIYVLGGMVGPMGLAFSINVVESALINPEKGLGSWIKKDSQEFSYYKTWKEAVPLDAQSHLKHARDYLSRKEFDVVFFDLDEALKIHPESYEAYNLKGDAHYRLGEIDLAEEALKKSLAIKKDNFNALVGLGNISYEKGSYEEAITYYEEGVKLNADSIALRDNLGNAYLSGGDYTAASKEFQWILDKEPDSEHARLLLDLSLKSLEEEDGGIKD